MDLLIFTDAAILERDSDSKLQRKLHPFLT